MPSSSVSVATQPVFAVALRRSVLPVRTAFVTRGATDPFAAYTPPAPPAPRVVVQSPPPPPPVVVIAPPPAPPAAPPLPVLPYRFLGAVREPGVAPRVFLARGEALITAQALQALERSVVGAAQIGVEGPGTLEKGQGRLVIDRARITHFGELAAVPNTHLAQEIFHALLGHFRWKLFLVHKRWPMDFISTLFLLSLGCALML